jgi:hypothetical protein
LTKDINIENFVTFFDRNYLPQGIALYLSMVRHLPHFKLWIVCVDDDTFKVIDQMEDPRIVAIDFDSFENDHLKQARTNRSYVEFLWTLTPFISSYVFNVDNSIDRVTYIDADMYFLRNPKEIYTFFDLSGCSALITSHDFSSKHDHGDKNGKFCVQFMPFNRNGSAAILEWWGERCLESCSSKAENGVFGDQKYIEEWPGMFPDLVAIYPSIGSFLAPWNMDKYPPKAGYIYHFHSLRILKDKKVALVNADYTVPDDFIKEVYKPYLSDLSCAQTMLDTLGLTLKPQGQDSEFNSLRYILKFIKSLGKTSRSIQKINLE